ncbi:MAG: peptide ABC transporter substrate-binding protein [Thermomicrobiales bacterium]|nr:peptide ABC transporter substrate-binding protein [Thermomicrobiales bacterium]
MRRFRPTTGRIGSGVWLNRRQALLLAAGAGATAWSPWWRGRARARQEQLPGEPTGPTAPPGAQREGEHLVVGAPREPGSLHPWLASTIAAYDLLDGVMDGLFRYSAAGKLQPALAESVAISDDGLTYTFALRQGVHYHNGEPFRGEDFVTAWELAQDRAFDALSTVGWQKVANVDVPDAATLVVTTSDPYAPFLSTVATTYLCPKAALAEGVESFREVYGRAPIGTGPFRIAAWEPGEAIALERWDGYWGTTARLASIDYRPYAGSAELVAALAAGEVDIAGGAGAIPPDRADEVAALPGVTLFQHGTMNWQHVDLKQMAFLRETPVRQALDFATPRDAIVADLLAGGATAAFADQSPASWAFSQTLRPRAFDPAQAASLLDQTGLAAGEDGVRTRDGKRFEIDLWGVEGDDQVRAILDRIAAEWNAIGVSTLVQTAPPDALWGPLGYQFSDRMTGCLYTWTNANDPDDLFYWHSSQIPTSPDGSGGNLPAFFYPYAFQEEIDGLTVDAASTLDLEERKALYEQIQSLLAREVPVLFLYWERAFPAALDDVGGFWPSAWTPLLWNAADWYLADGSIAATPVTGE